MSSQETFSITTLQRMCARSEYLDESDIHMNDKTVSWDGNIIYYKTKKPASTGNEFLIPIQVKGKEYNILPDSDSISYPVDINDLKNYLKNGGVIFFVDAISKTEYNDKMYAKILLPVDIVHIMKGKEEQGSITVHLNHVKTVRELEELCVLFKENRPKQAMVGVGKSIPDLKLGTRLRLQDDYDRYYARWDYNGSNNMFFSWGDVWYESNNDDSDVGRKNGTPDYIKAETLPIGVKVGPVKVGYYFQYYGALGNSEATDNHYESEMEHQIRLYAPLYQGEKLGLSFEGRFTIAEEQDWNNDGKDRADKHAGYREYDSFGRTRLYVKFDYKVTESLNVYGQYAYEWRDFDYQEGDKREFYAGAGKENYQDILVGWRYTF